MSLRDKLVDLTTELEELLPELEEKQKRYLALCVEIMETKAKLTEVLLFGGTGNGND